jgi:hypothetical protein
MVGVYWLATLVGWAFVAFFLFFGGDVDADLDMDADFDVDPGGDGELAVAQGGGLLSAVVSFLSFRNLVFFSAFFGLTGLLLTWADTNRVFTFIAAVGVGTFAAWVNHRLLKYLRSSSSDSTIHDRDIAGSPAEIVLPVGPGRKGKITVIVQGHRLQFTASAYDTADSRVYDAGDTVVVVEIDEGVARIAALDVFG